jgi:hypothetical protein
MRRGVVRIAKILCIAYLTGGMLTWAWDIWLEANHPEDYSTYTPSGERKFNTKQFVRVMAGEAIPTILFWPPMVGLEVGVRMGWICKSAEIGKC